MFGVVSITFVSAGRGFALGSVACGPGRCAGLLGTTDGGAHWRRLTPPARTLASSQYSTCDGGRQCVGQIRFASPAVGYAFAPTLLMTTDGGRHWRQLAKSSVSSLEPAGGTVLRVASEREGCTGKPYRLQSAAVGTDAWHSIGAPPLRLFCPPVLYRQGARLALVSYDNQTAGLPQPARIDRSADTGRSWAYGRDECAGGGGYASAVALAPPSTLVLVCQPQTGPRKPGWLRVSADGGATFGPAEPLPAPPRIPLGDRVIYQLAAATPARFVVLEDAAGSNRVMVTQDAGRSWSISLVLNGFATPTLAGFGGPLAARIGQGDVLWTTTDGARTWRASSFVPVP